MNTEVYASETYNIISSDNWNQYVEGKGNKKYLEHEGQTFTSVLNQIQATEFKHDYQW